MCGQAVLLSDDLQYILDENSVSRGGVVDHRMGYCADALAVLGYSRAEAADALIPLFAEAELLDRGKNLLIQVFDSVSDFCFVPCFLP